MSPLNHKMTTSSLAPPIICVRKNQQLKDRRFPQSLHFKSISWLEQILLVLRKPNPVWKMHAATS